MILSPTTIKCRMEIAWVNPRLFLFPQHGYKLAISRYEKEVVDIGASTIEIIKDILLPIALMVAGWLYGRHTKLMDTKDTTIRELTDHVNNLEDNNLDARLDEVESDIEELKNQFSNALDKFNASINGVKATIEEIKEDQDHLTKASQLNGRYTHELAILLMTLSEGIRDQHLDGNITRAIVRYRKFEQEVLGDIVSNGIDANTSDK